MKTLSQRLEDYILKHPYTEIENVYERVLLNHKKAIWKLQSRISERIENMLQSNERVFFLTFTFSDEFLPIKSEENQTENYMIDFFKNHPDVSMYVANTDYGKKNNRFHWHAVCLSKSKLNRKHWPYGLVKFKEVHKTSIPLKLTRYLIKLKRHATKIQDPLIIYFPFRYKKEVK